MGSSLSYLASAEEEPKELKERTGSCRPNVQRLPRYPPDYVEGNIEEALFWRGAISRLESPVVD